MTSPTKPTTPQEDTQTATISAVTTSIMVLFLSTSTPSDFAVGSSTERMLRFLALKMIIIEHTTTTGTVMATLVQDEFEKLPMFQSTTLSAISLLNISRKLIPADIRK